MVAKSFKSYEILCEPFKENGRLYVNIKNPNTGNIRKVRWYSEAEYSKLYPEDKIEDPYYKPQKITLGFEKGFITLVKGKVDKYWAVAVGARATRLWGWYIPSDTELPELPQGLSFQKLSWEEISKDEKLLPESDIVKITNNQNWMID